MAAEFARKGHFYVVGLGPGSPDLITLRAANILRSCDVLIAPRAENSPRSLALEIAKDYIGGQEVIERVYPMARDIERTRQCWAEMADVVIDRCQRGMAVAHITIGDPLIYSTAGYLIDQIAPRMSEEQWHVVPGISAFQAAAAATRQTLTRQEDRLTLMPASNIAEVTTALESCETLVLYKVGERLQALTEALEERGLAQQAILARHLGQSEKEKIVRGLSGVCSAKLGYMSTVIIRHGNRDWRPTSEG